MSTPSAPDDLRVTVDHVHRALTEARPHRVVIVGDVMLDRYVDGTSTRLSPEAPVPVIDVATEIERLGGVANVAVGLARLGASVVLVGMVGDDADGARVRTLLAEEPGIAAQLVVDPTRITTAKERVRVDGRHVIRVDREHRDPPAPAVRRAIERATQDALDGADVLVVSDYAKGAVDTRLISSLVGRPCTVVDPKHADVERYLGADVLAPNRAEALAAAAAAFAPGDPTLAESVLALHARLPGTALRGHLWRGRHGVVGARHREQPRARAGAVAGPPRRRRHRGR